MTRYKQSSLLDYIDTKLQRIHCPATRGSVVAFPSRHVPSYALGIAYGWRSLVVADKGVGWNDTSKAVAVWAVPSF